MVVRKIDKKTNYGQNQGPYEVSGNDETNYIDGKL